MPLEGTCRVSVVVVWKDFATWKVTAAYPRQNQTSVMNEITLTRAKDFENETGFCPLTFASVSLRIDTILSLCERMWNMGIFQSAFDGVSIQKKFTILLKLVYFFEVLCRLLWNWICEKLSRSFERKSGCWLRWFLRCLVLIIDYSQNTIIESKILRSFVHALLTLSTFIIFIRSK